jgi:hypothetical protein
MAEWADGLDRSVAIDESQSDFFGFAKANPRDLLKELASRWARALGRMDHMDYWNWANVWWFDTQRGFRILVYPFKVGPGFVPGYSLALLVTPYPDEGNETQPYDAWAYDNYKRELYDIVSQFGGKRLPVDLALSQHNETPDYRRYTEEDFHTW